MNNPIRNLRFVWKNHRMRRALLIAIVSDIIGFTVVLFPPVQWAVDAFTAFLLLVVLGFRWQLLAALAIEVIPFLELFPAWTLVVLAMAATTNQKELD